eukprot:MONOS_2106.1-p1 / transcript=MONOS_2106.1 / gene=MONOS_2106 / organism=Monocercomonoides_exilis_PA203 / gene_product=Piwi / transcript_product=Piwi / location=Mono_scaffold00041:103554-106817(+) / protein_length=812 / sequence_SO=supercontig / SO=protein_coding / is_pseudo=false
MTTELAKRPLENVPTPGSRTVGVIANSYRLDLNMSMYQYSVQFEPPLDGARERRIREGLMNEMIQKNYEGVQCVFDGTALYSYGQSIEEKTVELSRKRKDETHVYKLTVKSANVYVPSMPDFPYQWLNVFIRNIQQTKGFVQIRRDMLDPNDKTTIAGTRLEIWNGTRFVIYRSISGPTLCADKAHAIMRTDTLLEQWKQARCRLDSPEAEMLRNQVKGMCIVTKYGQRCFPYIVLDMILNMTPKTYKFKRSVKIENHKEEEGQPKDDKKPEVEGEAQGEYEVKEESLEEYYMDRYNIRLEDDQPILVCRPSGRGGSRLAMIPLQVAYATGVPDNVRRDFMMMKRIKESHQLSPVQRKEMIDKITLSLFESTQMDTLGISMKEKKMIQINARMAPPVELSWGAGRTVTVQNGSFRDATKQNSLLRPVQLTNWVVVYNDRDQYCLDKLLDGMRRVAQRTTIERPREIKLRGSRPRDFCEEFDQAFTPQYKNVQLVMFILPDKDTERYRQLKYITEVKKPVPSQAVTAINAKKAQLSMITGLWTQITQKLGGVCWSIPRPAFTRVIPPTSSPEKEDGGVMVASIILSKGKQMKEGTAAFVASFNHDMTQFHQRTMKCPPKSDVVERNFDRFMKESLDKYLSVNRKLPTWVFVYHDGLGEGMLSKSVKLEYPQLLNAFHQFDQDGYEYKPRHAFLCVEKKTNHRFFDVSGRNPQPGTIIDSDIVSDELYDFFIIAQSVNPQTTVLPARYIVTVDESGLSPAELQDFTHQLCYMYCNFFGSISMPLPIQMAAKLSQHSQEVLKGADSKLPNVSYQI